MPGVRIVALFLLIIGLFNGCTAKKPYANILSPSETTKQSLPPGISASDAPMSPPYVEPPVKPPE